MEKLINIVVRKDIELNVRNHTMDNTMIMHDSNKSELTKYLMEQGQILLGINRTEIPKGKCKYGIILQNNDGSIEWFHADQWNIEHLAFLECNEDHKKARELKDKLVQEMLTNR